MTISLHFTILKKGVKQKIQQIFLSITQSNTKNLILFLLIALGIPLTVFVAQQQQEVRQRASEYDDCADQYGCTFTESFYQCGGDIHYNCDNQPDYEETASGSWYPSTHKVKVDTYSCPDDSTRFLTYTEGESAECGGAGGGGNQPPPTQPPQPTNPPPANMNCAQCGRIGQSCCSVGAGCGSGDKELCQDANGYCEERQNPPACVGKENSSIADDKGHQCNIDEFNEGHPQRCVRISGYSPDEQYRYRQCICDDGGCDWVQDNGKCSPPCGGEGQKCCFNGERGDKQCGFYGATGLALACQSGGTCQPPPPPATPTTRPTNTPTPRPTNTPIPTAIPRPTTASVPTTAPLPTTPSTGTTGTPLVTATLAPTAPPVPGGTVVTVSVELQGIGTGGNTAPLRPQRNLTVSFYDTSSQLVKESTKLITYNSQTGKFSGSVDMGIVTAGTYSVKIKTAGYLTKLIQAPLTIQQGGAAYLLTGTPVLLAGDVRWDNVMNISDYTELIACYGAKANSPTCTNKSNADANDDGIVDGKDYNIMARNFSTRSGD